jgi:hypothetical protein
LASRHAALGSREAEGKPEGSDEGMLEGTEGGTLDGSEDGKVEGSDEGTPDTHFMRVANERQSIQKKFWFAQSSLNSSLVACVYQDNVHFTRQFSSISWKERAFESKTACSHPGGFSMLR